MKALLVLALAVAVSARPEPGFAYTVVDPGQGYTAAVPNVYTSVVTPNVYTSAITPNVYTAAMTPNVYTSVVTPNVYTSGVTPVVYNYPMVYQASGCRNNDGQAVPCAGGDFATPVFVQGEQKIEQQAVFNPPPVAPVAPVSSGGSAIVDVKKREAEPQYYYNSINPSMYSFAHQPLIYTQPDAVSQPLIFNQPIVATQPMVYAASPVGCRNNEGKVVACIGEAEPATEVVAKSLPVVEVDESKTRLEAAAEAAKIVAVKKREAEADPQFYYNPMTYTSPLAVTPNVYAQPQTVIAQPQTVVAQPQVAYAQPQTVIAQPQMTYAQPQVAYAQPQVTYAQPQTVIAQPQVTYAQPQVAYAQPQMTYAQPQMVYAQPQMVYAQTPVVYQQGRACHNDMGSVVPCALGDNFIINPVPNSVIQTQQPVVAPSQDVEVVQAAAAPSGEAIISVKKRDTSSEPLYYGDTYKFPGYTYRAFGDVTPVAAPTSYSFSAPIVSNVVATPVAATSYVATPVVANPYVAASPIFAAVQPGCRNEQGSVVPCA